MYSYGSSARAGGSGKRGHGGRPYRSPPDRSKQEEQPPPLKQCDCLVELDVLEYLTPTTPAGEPRLHITFGASRQTMQNVVQYVRRHFQCHLQIPGKNQGNPVALVATSVEEALPACYYIMQQLQIDETNIGARIHTNVKANLPVLVGRLYKVDENISPFGYLFRQESESTNATSWSVAYYGMSNPTEQ